MLHAKGGIIRQTFWKGESGTDAIGINGPPVESLYPQRGAIGQIVKGRFRLILPRGFLTRWHKAALPLDTGGPTELARRLNIHALAELLRHGTDVQRVEAADAFLSLGRRSAGAISELLQALIEDPLPSVRWRVLDTVRKIGTRASCTRVIAAALRDDPCRSVRWRAAEALGQGTVRSPLKIQALLAACGDSDSWVRWHAQRALSTAPSAALLPHLIISLSPDSRPAVRAFVLRALSRHSDLTLHSLRRIIARGLCDPYPEVCEAATELLVSCSDSSSSVMAALRRCLQSRSASVRTKAVRALEAPSFQYRSVAGDLRRALRDPEPNVRRAALEVLTRGQGSPSERKHLLARGLHDSEVAVREAAAVGLCKLGISSRNLMRRLVNDLNQGNDSLRVWRCIIELTRRMGGSEMLLGKVPPSILYRCVTEDVAEGVLPTIGLRLWPRKARIRFPNKEGGDLPPRGIGYPWVNAGVRHSWEGHAEPFQRRLHAIVIQACFPTEPFPHIHLISASQFMLVLPTWLDAEVAPVHIEGRPVAFVIQGGGNITVLPGMKCFAPVDTNARTDFLHASNLCWVQYATYAASSERLPASVRSPLEALAANLWLKYVERIIELLVDFSLGRFVEEEWFDNTGWESSRYGLRWERRYDELRPGIVQLFRTIRSSQGGRLRRVNQEITGELINNIEVAIWTSRLSTYPDSLLVALESGIAGARVASFASALRQAANPAS